MGAGKEVKGGFHRNHSLLICSSRYRCIERPSLVRSCILGPSQVSQSCLCMGENPGYPRLLLLLFADA